MREGGSDDEGMGWDRDRIGVAARRRMRLVEGTLFCLDWLLELLSICDINGS